MEWICTGPRPLLTSLALVDITNNRGTSVRRWSEHHTRVFHPAVQYAIVEGTNYLTAMPIIYNSMQDHVRMRRAIMMTQIFNELSEIALSPQTWAQHNPPAGLYTHARSPGTYTPRLGAHTIALRPVLVAEDGRLPFTTIRFEVEYAREQENPAPLRVHDVVLWREYQITGPTTSRHSQTYLTMVVDRLHEVTQDGATDIYRYDTVLLGFATGDTNAVPRRTLRERPVHLTVAVPQVITYFGTYARQLDALHTLRNAPENPIACLCRARVRLARVVR